MSPNRSFVACIAVCLLLTATAFAEVPNLVSYQGRLTDDAGMPVADGEYSIAFTVYIGPGLLAPAVWSDTMMVTASDGLFTVLLGSETPLLPEVFDGTTRYLGITIVGGTEMTPRTPIVSVPYAMVAGNAISTEVDCHNCDTIYVNTTGPETITAIDVDTTLTVINTGNGIKCGVNIRVDGGNDVGDIYGVKVSASNNGAGNFPAYGGLFQASGGNAMQYGVYGQGINNAPIFPAYGVSGHGQNYSPDGDAYGGYFAANGTDPSNHYGARGYANAKGASLAIGLNGEGGNSDEGTAIGGLFVGGSAGTGRHFGVKSFGYGNYDSTATGVYGYAANNGVGQAIGGEFVAASGGDGQHFGLNAICEANNDFEAIGCYAVSANSWSGRATGGRFEAHTGGIGRHFGTFVTSEAHNDSITVGSYAYAMNSNTGSAIGGYFYVPNSGVGTHTGISANAYGGSQTKGIFAYANNSSTGPAIGGQFDSHTMGSGGGSGVDAYVFGGSDGVISGVNGLANCGNAYGGISYGGYFMDSSGTNYGTHYGVYGAAKVSTSNSNFGFYGRSTQSGSGSSYGGYFVADSSGTGTSYGTRNIALSKGTAAAYGISSVAANRSTGAVYGGYFEALDLGTGTNHYGVYCKAPAAWYAGYFSGNVRVSGDFSVVGIKSAAVKMDDGDYRLVYCQESPENWFEDFGDGQMTDGRARIELDPLFLETVTIDQANPMKVFIQLNDDCNGTYVKTSLTGFDVYELQKGSSDASFTYRVVAKRRGYEDVRLAKMAGPTPEEAEAEAALNNEQLEADMKAADEDRIRQKELAAQRDAEKIPMPEEIE